MGLFTERDEYDNFKVKQNNMKRIALVLNGFGAGWLLGKSGFTWDCIIAFFAIGITSIYLTNKKCN